MPSKKLHQLYRNASGVVVPSVTTIISNNLGWNKNILIAWARKQAALGLDPEAIKQEAADTGTLAHKLIEEYIISQCPHLTLDEGDKVKLSTYTQEQITKANNGLGAFKEWVAKNSPSFDDLRTQTEQGMVSNWYNYGGTIDFLVVLNGELCLVDFKTSNGVYPDHRIQLAAYHWLIEENLGVSVPAHLIQLSKEDASFHHHFYPDLSLEWEVFQHLLELNRYRELVGA